MEYIDKSKSDNAHQLLDGFLTRCNSGGFKPTDNLYQKMKSDRTSPDSDTTYDLLREQLVQENNGRCCYCMRNLNEAHTTLEHVIPNRTATQEEYNGYKPYFSADIWNKMVFTKVFLQHPRWPNAQYPHSVAYENLIPSCDGKFAMVSRPDDCHPKDDRISKCCNNKRGDEMVIPFVFDKTMVSQFLYKKNGYVVWPVDPNIQGKKRKELLEQHKLTIDNLGLNCPELVAIRRIWFFLSSSGLTSNVEEKDKAILLLTENRDLTYEEKDMLNNFALDNYWTLLNEYGYFNDEEKFTK